MRYINESLVNDEHVIFATRPHWIIFTPSLGIFIFAALVWHLVSEYLGGRNLFLYGHSFAFFITMIVLIVGLFLLIKSYLLYITSEYGVTNRRVIMKTGLISRNAIEIFLQRLEAVNVSQTVLGRILGYGTVIIIGTGGTNDCYANVPRPVQFQRIVQQQMDLLIDVVKEDQK